MEADVAEGIPMGAQRSCAAAPDSVLDAVGGALAVLPELSELGGSCGSTASPGAPAAPPGLWRTGGTSVGALFN